MRLTIFKKELLAFGRHIPEGKRTKAYDVTVYYLACHEQNRT